MKPEKRKAPVLVSICIGLAIVILAGMWPTRRPNVVVIVVDTLRADAVSIALGDEETPAIAALVADGGIPFSQAFSHAPMTLPAHAAMFTGRHPSETGVTNNGQRVPEDLPLLAEHLAGEGYRTSAVLSLATMWPEAQAAGLDRGFEHYDQGALEVSPAQHTSPRIEAALDRLGGDKPFFLFAHLSDPHEPYNDGGESGRHVKVGVSGQQLAVLSTSEMSYWELDVTLAPGRHELSFTSDDAFKLRSLSVTAGGEAHEFSFIEGDLLEERESLRVAVPNFSDADLDLHLRGWVCDVPTRAEIRARYLDEVARADEAIGALIASLKRRGLFENTMIVVTSDHGEALGEHGTIGHVVSLYDELLHVPLIVRLPRGRLDPRLIASREQLVRHVDLGPTILEELKLSGLPAPSGSSLFTASERTLLAETHPPEAPRALFCARDEQYKLIFSPEDESFEMFRLGPDPLELDNVFAHQGHLRDTWQRVLRKLATEASPLSARDDATQAKLSALGY